MKAFFTNLCLLLFAVIACGPVASAQDLIVKKNGEAVEVRIMKVGYEDVHYVLSDEPDGPVRVMPLWMISHIRYSDGHVEGRKSDISIYAERGEIRDGEKGRNYSAKELQEILSTAEYSQYLSAVKTHAGGRSKKTAGFITCAAGGAVIGIALGNIPFARSSNRNDITTSYVVSFSVIGAGVVVGGFFLVLAGQKLTEKAHLELSGICDGFNARNGKPHMPLRFLSAPRTTELDLNSRFKNNP